MSRMMLYRVACTLRLTLKTGHLLFRIPGKVRVTGIPLLAMATPSRPSRVTMTGPAGANFLTEGTMAANLLVKLVLVTSVPVPVTLKGQTLPRLV